MASRNPPDNPPSPKGSSASKTREPGESGPAVARRSRKLAQIRHAAYRCFTQSGYHQTTVENICRAADISKGSFYWHFNSKQEVFLSILERWTKVVEVEMARQFRDALDSPDPISAVTTALEKEARRGQHIMPVWLEFLSQVNRDESTRQALDGFHQRIRNVIGQLLKPFLASRFANDEITVVARLVLASFLGLICQYLTNPEESSLNEQIQEFMPILRSYLEPAPRR